MNPPAESTIRPMVAEDIDAVLAIEARVFSTPWQADTFLSLIGRPGAEMWVIDDADGLLIAYSVLWCIFDQGELANIAVAPEHRGQGIAVRLLEHLVAVEKERGVTSIYLEVRASNDRATELYLGFGFEEVGVRKGYYNDPKEDGRVMRLTV